MIEDKKRFFINRLGMFTCSGIIMLRNEMGQLGLGDTKDRFCPTVITELSGHNVVKVFILTLVCQPLILDRKFILLFVALLI